jgi:hypothetical protein
LDAVPPEINLAVFELAGATGATIAECRTAVEQSRPIPNAPYVVTQSPGLDGLGMVETARESLLDDMLRIQNPARLPDNTVLLQPDEMHFTFRIQDAAPVVSRVLPDEDPDANDPEAQQAAQNAALAANKAIVDKLADLCGRAHPAQLSAVYYALSQSGAGAKVKLAFTAHHIASTEHMPLAFAITRSNETGAIEIVCSEPEGFPLHFRWTTTVALDGTVNATPLVVEPPPPAPAAPAANDLSMTIMI